MENASIYCVCFLLGVSVSRTGETFSITPSRFWNVAFRSIDRGNSNLFPSRSIELSISQHFKGVSKTESRERLRAWFPSSSSAVFSSSFSAMWGLGEEVGGRNKFQFRAGARRRSAAGGSKRKAPARELHWYGNFRKGSQRDEAIEKQRMERVFFFQDSYYLPQAKCLALQTRNRANLPLSQVIQAILENRRKVSAFPIPKGGNRLCPLLIPTSLYLLPRFSSLSFSPIWCCCPGLLFLPFPSSLPHFFCPRCKEKKCCHSTHGSTLRGTLIVCSLLFLGGFLFP